MSKSIRQFLVKNFVLDYRTKLFGKYYNSPRASRIIYPLMVIAGYLTATNPNYPYPSFLGWVFNGLLALSLFFGFIYFRFYPAKWEELDDFQKLQYGFFKFDELTPEQFKEYQEISDRYNK
jgi:hypothetical protein